MNFNLSLNLKGKRCYLLAETNVLDFQIYCIQNNFSSVFARFLHNEAFQMRKNVYLKEILIINFEIKILFFSNAHENKTAECYINFKSAFNPKKVVYKRNWGDI